ncbi:MAG: hypothetical protein H8E79_00105 [Desulfobulbaceae bacterium]|uniref:DUF5666 domain-containing protein n=1 Tax=Candidatus Desulfatifera sulfidica TaxID=2841691 RepID=A0A8J6T8M0_9BACT|nr:hypothetical protein [Candidatus Desulfatifera sulfidica]
MNKGIVSALMALVFAISTVGVAAAANIKCTVDSVAGTAVTLTCKEADSMKAGDKVTVKTKSKAAKVEGC